MFDGARLKVARKKAGLRQAEVADAIDVPVGTYRNWEQSLHEPNGANIKALVELLNTSADYLLRITDNPEPYSRTPAFQHAAYDGGLEDLTEEEREDLLMTVAIRRELMKKKREEAEKKSGRS